uniref:ARAD1C26356p n=1 Tax=Blastobotrys adeninivorans TaxID=409370 RepID=A0A060T1P6_BLAAD
MAVEYPKLEFLNLSWPAEFVLHVELNRPKYLNAMHQPAYEEYGKVMALAGEDPDVRVIVVSGNGKSFSAGIDINALTSMGDTDVEEPSRKAIYLYRHLKHFQKCISMPAFIDKPVIAVIHGHTLGLGVDIISACDFRYAVKGTKLSVRETAIGMTADIGSLQRLPKLASLGWVKEVSYTGRDFLAEEAEKNGLVERLFDSKEDALKGALDVAKSIASLSPVAVQGTKKSINYAIDHTHEESLEQIANFNSYALGADIVQGAMAARSKEKPRYEKL